MSGKHKRIKPFYIQVQNGRKNITKKTEKIQLNFLKIRKTYYYETTFI